MKEVNRIDFEVASEVIGWRDVKKVQTGYTYWPVLEGVDPSAIPSEHTSYMPRIQVPHYSRDINAAVTALANPKFSSWAIRFDRDEGVHHCQVESQGNRYLGSHKELAKAICEACLKAVRTN